MSDEAIETAARDGGASPVKLLGGAKRLVGLGALLICLLILALGGAYWLRQRLSHVEESDAQTASDVAAIASRLDGWVVARPVMEGDRVAKGQALVELDCRDARLRLAALERNLAAHDAQIRQATLQRDTSQQTSEAEITDARAQLAAAEAAVGEATSQADIAQADFARADPLVDRGDISRQNWDHARSARLQQAAALRQAQAQLAARQAALTQAIAQSGQVAVLEQQIEVLRGERAALAAQTDQVRQEIADRTVRAPFDSIVDRTFIHVGDYVQTGQWLMMLHDPGNLWVEANVKETEVGRVRVGDMVSVALRGRVLRVGNAATNQFALLPSPNPSGNFTKITQRVPVRIAIDLPERPLQPGLMVEVSIDVAD